MNELQIFDNQDFGSIRTLEQDGEVLFCGTDVAAALGYANPRKAVRDHSKGGTKCSIGVRTGKKADGTPAVQMVEMLFVPESDVYRLIVHSKLPTAERFEKWVFDEVLPSIRKHGGYIAGQESLSDTELMARALIVAKNALQQRDEKITELETMNSILIVDNQIMKPKAEYFDDLVDRNLLTSIRETAKQLQVKEKEFVKLLMDKKFLYRDKKSKLMPYAEKNDGLFVVKECYNEKTGWSGTQTLVTPKGRETFRLLCEGM